MQQLTVLGSTGSIGTSTLGQTRFKKNSNLTPSLRKGAMLLLGTLGLVTSTAVIAGSIESDPIDSIRPPTTTPVAIVASNNLTATGPVLADVGTGSTGSVPVSPKVKFDAAYSVCQAVVPTIHKDFALANHVGPGDSVADYFLSHGISLEAIGPSKVVVTEQPQHGNLRLDSDGGYVYYPNEGYLGPDQMTFVVEAQGKKFKVIETVWVADMAPEFGGCPADYKLPPADGGNNKGSALDILELPTDGPLDAEALAKLHSMVSFSMGAGLLGNGSLFKIADLPGGAVGQTTGEGANATITLDTTAAGHNWLIDTTPADNSEFLPTSNPYEWVAKAGTAAYGKMDMLSVLLHEYGHALDNLTGAPDDAFDDALLDANPVLSSVEGTGASLPGSNRLFH